MNCTLYTTVAVGHTKPPPCLLVKLIVIYLVNSFESIYCMHTDIVTSHNCSQFLVVNQCTIRDIFADLKKYLGTSHSNFSNSDIHTTLEARLVLCNYFKRCHR